MEVGKENKKRKEKKEEKPHPNTWDKAFVSFDSSKSPPKAGEFLLCLQKRNN